MARSKTVPDNQVLDLIQKFFIEECEGSINKLKIPAIAEYIAKETNADYKATTLRRTKAAKEYLEVLKETVMDQHLNVVTVYKSLDIEAFLDKNRTRGTLKKSLSELDSYYKSIADSAVELNRRSEKSQSKISTLENTIKKLEIELEKAKQNINSLKEENKQLRLENSTLTSVVEDYVYPEIANELLAKDGFIKNTAGSIDKSRLDNKLIDANTDIFSESNVIQGLFDKYKE